jgi:hypothetical protein
LQNIKAKKIVKGGQAPSLFFKLGYLRENRKSSFDGDSLGAFEGFSSQMELSVIFRMVGGLRGVISVFN